VTSGDLAALKDRLQEAQAAPYVSGRFYAEYEVDGRVLMKCKGVTRGFRSGVVMIEEESETGSPVQLLRVGGKSWIYKEGWQDSTGTPWASLGQGFQNPFEVLNVLQAAADRFVPHRQGGMALDEIRDRAILDPLSARAGAAPSGAVRLEGVLKQGFRDGPLITRISAEDGKAMWLAKLDIDRWGPAPPMRFDDIPAPFTPDMNAAVRKARQEEK
jgi:hypothetical protein